MPSRSRQLHYLATVAQEGQITRAARRLGLAQAALSQSIAQLEGELGVQLLERHPRGVNLTLAGEAFIAKATAAVAAEEDAARTARMLARAERGALAVGFVGPPPALSSPALFAAFATANPALEVSYQDMVFPTGSTAGWLADVDVAVCHLPRLEEGIGRQVIRREPRAIVVPTASPLAAARELRLEDVLEQRFVAYHRSVQSEWAAFHTLDDHRGAPPARTTLDAALSSLHMLGILSTTRALAAIPLTDALLARQVLVNSRVQPLSDAAPAEVALVWREENSNPLISELATFAAASA